MSNKKTPCSSERLTASPLAGLFAGQAHSPLEGRKRSSRPVMPYLRRALLVLVGVFSMQSHAQAGCEDPAGPGVNWTGCDKSGLNLAGADLQSAVLRRVNFSDTDLSGARMQTADLSFSKLINTRFEKARLEQARINNTEISNSSFKDAILDEARLSRATISNSNFTDVRASKVNFYQVSIVNLSLIHI